VDISFTLRLFVCLFVGTVTDFSAEDKASGIKFCTAVHRRPRQGIAHFGELCSPRSPKSDESASAPLLYCDASILCDSHAYQVRMVCGRRIGMCGYMAVPEDGRICFIFLVQSQEIGWEERLRNGLFCVKWGVKPPLSQSTFMYCIIAYVICRE